MRLNTLEYRRTAQKGWGMFTTKKIKAGTIIELAPVIVMTAAEKEMLNQTELYNYIFDWEGDACCMALGCISLYNHSSPSNCEYFQLYEEGTMYIQTVRDIAAQEELTINYNGDHDNHAPVWFETVKE
jgi:SET domain-containing protein